MLKILSGKLLFRQVPGIIDKSVSFLKSKAIDITVQCDGKYIGFVIKVTSAILTRGYLQHFHTFTSHSQLAKLAKQSMLVPGDLDTVVSLLTDVALSEMFSSIAEVRKIPVKLMVVAKFVSNDQLFSLVKQFADKAAKPSLGHSGTFRRSRRCSGSLCCGCWTTRPWTWLPPSS